MNKVDKSLENRRFGRLTVKQRTYRTRHGQYWLCSCECGQDKEVRHDHLLANKIQSCGCLNKGQTSSKYTGYQDISGEEWSRIKDNAKQRNIDFNIEIEDVWDLFIKQNKKCALTGQELDFNKYKGTKDSTNGNASLDRIDSSQGYTIENIWWLHKDVNKAKGSLPLSKFIQYCNLVFNPLNIATAYCDVFEKHFHWKGIGNISGYYLNRTKRGAEQRNIDYSVNDEYLWDLFVQQQGKCNLTGLPIVFKNKKEINLQTASLDRIFSNKDYIKGNLQWIHKDLQFMKLDFDPEYFKSLCKLVSTRGNRNTTGKVDKFWGDTQCIFVSPYTEMHNLHINKGGFCSRHKHEFKYNRFCVLDGKIKVILYTEDGTITEEKTLSTNDMFDVKPNIYHSFDALEDSIVVEIYWVDTLNPYDISRQTIGGNKN